MADNLLERIGTLLRRRPWYELPRFLAMPRLIEMRNTLREKNLHDTEEPPFVREEIPPDLDPRLRDERRDLHESAIPKHSRTAVYVACIPMKADVARVLTRPSPGRQVLVAQSWPRQ